MFDGSRMPAPRLPRKKVGFSLECAALAKVVIVNWLMPPGGEWQEGHREQWQNYYMILLVWKTQSFL